MKDFDLTKNIQIISVIVLCGAVLKHQIYYAYFHIPIYKYIDFSEIIPLFLDQVLVISILVVIFTIFAYLTSGYKTELHQKIYLEENFRKRLKIIYKNAPISLKIITILIYILIVVDLFFGNNPFNKVMTIMTGMIPLLVILILEISYKKNKVEGEKLSNLTILYII